MGLAQPRLVNKTATAPTPGNMVADHDYSDLENDFFKQAEASISKDDNLSAKAKGRSE